MAQNSQNASSDQQAADDKATAPAKKAAKFSFSFDFFRKNNSNNEFAGKVAPSRRELEARATKRRAQKAKTQGGIKQQNEETDEQLQTV